MHRRFDLRYLAVALGLVFSWSEVTGVWKDWGFGGVVFSYGAFIPLQAASAWVLWRAARRPDLPAGAARALRAFALGFVFLGLGSLVLAGDTIQQALLGRDEGDYSLADFFYAFSYPWIVAGFLLLPRRQPGWGARIRGLLDTVAILVMSGLLIYVNWTLRAKASGLGAFLSTAYPLLAAFSLVPANRALTRGLVLPSRRAWFGLVIPVTLILFSDIVIQSLWATGYHGPNWSVPIAVAINLVVLWAAEWWAKDPLVATTDEPGGPLLVSPLPSLLAIGGAGILLLMVSAGNSAALWPVLQTLIALNLVLVARDAFFVVAATRQARREAELLGERRFEALVRRATDLILVVDQDQVIRFASPAAASLLGRPGEELVGRPLEGEVHPEDAEATRDALTALLAAPATVATLDLRLRHANGAWRRFESSAANLCAEPAVGGLVLNARDVTDRLQLEEQLRQAQKMEVVGQIAGGVAHDFNNLLTTVMAGSDFALEALAEKDPVRAEILGIRDAAQRGAALTSRLLAFSRPSGTGPKVVRLGERIAGLRPLMQRLVGDGVQLLFTAEAGAGAARVDPDELEHALLNLVANARDAMNGRGILRIDVASRLLDTALRSSVLSASAGRYMVIRVADTGHGMDSATQARLFQPFFTTKPHGQGTGLGLSGVREFMRRSHGGITLESAPGEGSCFTLWFPAVAEEEAPESRQASHVPVPGHEVILLAEDDDVVRRTTARILVAGGYTVHAARDAVEARRLFAEHGPGIDMLVTDVMMPGQSGVALAEVLRAERPGLPVLLVSGYPGEDLSRLGVEVGEVDLLRKPYTARELTARVRAVLAGKAATTPES